MSRRVMGAVDRIGAPRRGSFREDGAGMAGARKSATVVASLGALVVAPVVVGIAVTVVRLLGTGHPDAGWSAVINSDAAALYHGQGLFNDPNVGYSGMY